MDKRIVVAVRQLCFPRDTQFSPLYTLYVFGVLYFPSSNLSADRGGHFMALNEFQRPVSVDFAPHDSLCEWCHKPAEQRLTAVGGKYHNESGVFCRSCGELFTQGVANSRPFSAASQAYRL